MSLRSALRTEFFGGGGLSSLVPYVWDVAINGRTYMLDWKYAGTPQLARSSVKLRRPQQGSEVGEASLNPAEGERAKLESWHKGAGQEFVDRENSDPHRFRSSKGIDPWTKWKVQLLPDTTQKRASVNTNLKLVTAGSRLYLLDGQSTLFTTDLAAYTTVTGTPAVTGSSLASDGYYVWTAYGASGVYVTNTGGSAGTQLVSSALDSDAVLGYAKGRLMVANGDDLYNVTTLTGTAALPAALYTHPNPEFTWVGFAEGQAHIYAAGYVGDKSQVFKIGIKTDGSGLDVPIVAGVLPDGEIIRSISSYLTLLLIGTDSGVWVAEQDSEGNLALNKVVDTSSAVRCFEGQGTYVWFGWSAYDGTSTGLGRMDLTQDTAGRSVVTPAYASDLMVTSQAAVLDAVTFANARVFSVSGLGIYTESSDLVAEGTIDSGRITFGFPDDKVPSSLLLSFEPLDGTIEAFISREDSGFSSLSEANEADSTSFRFSVGETAGEFFELRLVLSRDAVTTVGPVVTRATLEANPAPGRGETFTVALLWRELLEVDGKDRLFDCAEEYAYFLDWETTGAPVTFQDCLGSHSVIVDDHDFIIEDFTSKRDGYQGTLLASLRRPRRT